MPVTWCALPDDALLYKAWGGDAIVFNRRSNETHLLTVLPAEVLLILRQAPTTAAALSAQLAARCEVADDADWRCKVDGMLSDLHKLGLVSGSAT